MQESAATVTKNSNNNNNKDECFYAPDQLFAAFANDDDDGTSTRTYATLAAATTTTTTAGSKSSSKIPFESSTGSLLSRLPPVPVAPDAAVVAAANAAAAAAAASTLSASAGRVALEVVLDECVVTSTTEEEEKQSEKEVAAAPAAAAAEKKETEFILDAGASSAELGGAKPSEVHEETSDFAHTTRHEVVLPPGFDTSSYVPIKSHKPPPSAEWARTYPFKLDPFQLYSIYCIQRCESVLVAAHTSAGKTVVAEYAIAQALKNRQRVIYTSPIKALSNQKYRELCETFGDVGLMTGDVTIAPRASCLVMTTEILRSMLYRGSEILREIAWVVYDEIHYMRDKERGVVWEETLILLPHSVRLVFLSATIPNAKQFAQWICRLHSQPCHVVYTDFRPTPLQHYVFPAKGTGIHLVVNEKGVFREDNFEKAMSLLSSSENNNDQENRDGNGNRKRKFSQMSQKNEKDGSDIYKIVKMILRKNYHPVIVFSFGKRECETLAVSMSKVDYNTDDEKAAVSNVFKNAISLLSESDQTLDPINNLLPLLRRGIGIHHSGLLPILKEIVELLFQEGLLKVLFATETFSIGLNMPAKTVVFTRIEKFDGKESRHLTGGEYIQMSGRAGRRGLDDKGIVIMMVDQKIDTQKARQMIKGVADPLFSAFRLGYNMILNLLRVEGVTPEFLIRNSFRQFQSHANLPQMQHELALLEREYASFNVSHEAKARYFYDARFTYRELKNDHQLIISHPDYARPFLSPGRLVHIVHRGRDFGWGILLNFARSKVHSNDKNSKTDGKDAKESEEPTTSGSQFVLDVALIVDAESCSSRLDIKNLVPMRLPVGVKQTDKVIKTLSDAVDAPFVEDNADTENDDAMCSKTTENPQTPVLQIVPVLLKTVSEISTVVMRLPKNSGTDVDSKRKLHILYNDVMAKLSEKQCADKEGNCIVPTLDPVEHMKITDPQFQKLAEMMQHYEKIMSTYSNALPVHEMLKGIKEYRVKLAMSERLRNLRRSVAAAVVPEQIEELRSRMRVLRRLGYVSESGVVEFKGRVACEISTGDPILLTELLFHGVFNKLTPAQCVALLSTFTFQEKVGARAAALRPPPREELMSSLRELHDIARRIAAVSIESRLDLNEKEFVEQFKPDLMELAYAWASGATFAQICKMSDVFEGNIVRNFRLLEELLKQMSSAARAIGNQTLEVRFSECITCIKRDIIFANSLYI